MPARTLLPALALALAVPAAAYAADPIRIGVIAENSAISGIPIPNAANIAADEINAKGGVDGRMIEIVAYDDHNSAADAVRAFQRAVSQDHVSAVIASYTSEVALALEPWAGRLHMPTITPGAASDDLSKRVHADYDHLKYFFPRLHGVGVPGGGGLRRGQGPADGQQAAHEDGRDHERGRGVDGPRSTPATRRACRRRG